ncbi:MAG: UDP-N-acetylmuramoylalanyl-D-glutamyl-2,6-diamino pimelate--D-alanyl-D-alanine ligase [Methyloligellaceae bacterium]
MSGVLWTYADILAAVDGLSEGSAPPDLPVTSVSIDTRTLEPGALFVAIRGERLDGHDYVAQAFEAGAACALVAEDAQVDGGGPLVVVPDTLAALEALGRSARARTSATIIAVTGSVGKTGTKEGLRLALAPSGKVHASEKSYNNQWGVPLSLANMPADTAFGVFEIGMNHPGEITPLTRMVRPGIAIVTTVEPVHLEFFDSVAQIAEAKAEIFAGLEPGGTAILNRDNPHFALLQERAEQAGAGRILSFGRHRDAAVRLIAVREESDGSRVEADIEGASLSYVVGSPGLHLVLNSLAILAAVKESGGDLASGAEALRGFRAQTGRGAREVFELPAGAVLLIDESYNANPASMRAALRTLGGVARSDYSRRVAVLGDMLELGGSSPQLHRDLAEAVDEAGVDVVFACGQHMRGMYDALSESRRGGYAATSQELLPVLLDQVGPGDAIMVKGSLGSQMGLLVDAVRSRFSSQG